MESSKAESICRKQDTASVCEELNLDIVKLEDDALMSNPIYRRLVNIVKSDMSRGDLTFRKNLIKELYFLLQIAPIIRPQHKEKFLIEVQKMYNLNDHKKIDLASNKLNNLISRFNTKKETTYSGQERPKSGVNWNQNVIPFLRPYTATRQKSKKESNPARPDSSKYNSQSTKVETLADICIREFTTNIQQELEISQDFIDRHRTNHPEYEPVYEQLHQILKKIENYREDDQIQEKPKSTHKTLKYPKSALTRHQEENWVRPEVSGQSEQCIPLQESQADSGDEEPREAKLDEEKLSEIESSEEEEYLYVNEQKKPFKAFSKTIKIVEETPELKMKNQNINKYTHLMSSKLVYAMREDEQMAKKYVHYARVKSTLKKQINRRNQSRRLMSAKQTTKSALKFSKLPHQKENMQEVKALIVNLAEDPKALPGDKINAYPTYNRRHFLKDLYEQPIDKFKKNNCVGYPAQSLEGKAPALKRPMTSYTRFHSPIRFDPMSPDNVKQYNADVLEQIEKIKMKVGGKCYASTESLMKALAVVQVGTDDSLPRWEDRNLCFNMVSQGKGKKLKKKRRNLKSSKKVPLKR